MNKIKLFVLSAMFSGFGALAPVIAHAAGSASLNFAAGSSRTVGSTFTVSVVENSGATEVNGVQADVNYDASKLQLIGKSCGAFEIAAPSSGANLVCATLSPKTNSQTVGTLSFKIVTAGSATMSFAPSSQITSKDGQGTNVWNGAANGVSYSFTAPAPKATPTPVKHTAAPIAATAATPTPTPTPTTVVKPVAVKKTVAVANVTKPTPSDTASTGMWRILGYLSLAALAIAGFAYFSRRRAAAAETVPASEFGKKKIVKAKA